MRYQKIYVAAPSNARTGGGESLHQLVGILNDVGQKAYIYYFDAEENFKGINALKKYNLCYAETIEDDDDNVLIVPEMYTKILRKYKKIKKIIWWLSLDFYIRSLPWENAKYILGKRNLPKALAPLLAWWIPLVTQASGQNYKVSEMKNIDFHFFNCEYVRRHLVSIGIDMSKTMYLCGPIDSVFINPHISEKENILLFNPSKANHYTYTVIDSVKKLDSTIKIVPLKNLNSFDLLNLYCKAKVYMDLGYFPGPERMPREAVSCFCNIITSLNGSAKNEVDVPIPNENKFDLSAENIDVIANKIVYMFKNYENECHKFDRYREMVMTQATIFKENIIEFIR